MTLLPFLAFAFAVGLAAWFGRSWPRIAVGIGLAGLLGALVLAVGLPEQAETVVAGETVSGGPYLRLFVAAACVSGIGFSILLLAAVPETERDRLSLLPAGFLLFAGAAALTLALPGPFAALLVGSGAGLSAFAVIGQIAAGEDEDEQSSTAADGSGAADASAGAGPLAFELLRVGIAASLAIVVTAALAGEADVLAGVPFGIGLADLALAVAVALRLGVIPLHGAAARLIRGAPRGASALLLAWGPAVFAAAALGASQSGVVPLGLPLSTERGLIVGIGVLSIVLGGLVAVAQDDIDRAVLYSIAQDAGFAMVAFAGTDTTVWGPARSWLLIFAIAKTAFLAWAVAVAITFGTRSLGELRGWVRRAPLLAITLVGVALATIGLPGMAAFESRAELLNASLRGPVQVIIALASFGGLLVYGRLLLIGLAEPSVMVLAAPGEGLRRPMADPPAPAFALRPADPARVRPVRRGRTSAAMTVRAAIAVNRTPISAALAAALATVALLFGAGLFELRPSAAMNLPPPLPAGQNGQPGEPTFRPVPTEPPPTSTPSEAAPADSPGPSAAAS